MAQVLWFYGLSGSGKTTAAEHALLYAHQCGLKTCLLDSDYIRASLWPEVGLKPNGRIEHINRVVSLMQLIPALDLIVVAAMVPYEVQRTHVLRAFPAAKFVHVVTPLHICKQRKPNTYENPFAVEHIEETPSPSHTIDGVLPISALHRHVEHIVGTYWPD